MLSFKKIESFSTPGEYVVTIFLDANKMDLSQLFAFGLGITCDRYILPPFVPLFTVIRILKGISSNLESIL